MPGKETILITGANGFIGAHIVAEALAHGHTVVATARSPKSLSSIRDTFPNVTDRLSLAQVSDITDPDSYKDALADSITAIIHTAAPFKLDVEDNRRDLLDPSIQGATAVLEAASKYGKNVKHVVSTSSFAAIVDLSKGARPGYEYSEDDWNSMSYDDAAQGDGTAAYTASKGLAEKAQWRWMDEHKPSFRLTCINPSWVFGPNVKPIPISDLGQSSKQLYSLLDSKEVPPPDFAGAVDVRDVAKAHMSAIGNERAAGQRFLLSQSWDWQLAVDDVREQLPELRERLPVGRPGKKAEQAVVQGRKAEGVLGFEYTPLKRTLKDSFTQFIESEKISK